MPHHVAWILFFLSTLFFLFFFILENVSEHLQIQGSEVQDSHKAIVKDLADVRHKAQDIYQKIGKWLKSFVVYKTIPPKQCAYISFCMWLSRPQYDRVSAVSGSDLPVLH